MPAGDRRGPQGMGPATGRGLGLCRGNDSPGYFQSGGSWAGRRGGGGRCGGGRRGFRNWFHATGVPGYGRFRNDRVSEAADEAIELRNQAQYLKTELERINSRLSTIENGERGE